MKINEKILSLISYGLKPTWVSSLNESHINQLYKRMINKKRLDEQGTPQPKVTEKRVKEIELAPNSSTNIGGMSVSNKGGKTVITQANEGEMTEKAVSKQQQKLMGLALSVKKGDTPKSKVSKKVKDMSKNMSKSDLEDFASTKHKGLPNKVEAKEGGYKDMIGKAMNKNMANKISDIKPSLKWESILEDEFSQIIENTIFPKMSKKDFIKTIMESPTIAPERERTKEKEEEKKKREHDKNDPFRPGKRQQPKPAPKAKHKHEVSESPEVAPAPVKVPEREKEKTPDKNDPFRPGKRIQPKPAPKAKLPDWLSSKSLGLK
jgi:hypothetical protein